VEAARQLLATGDGYAAVALLERDGSSHPLVEEALKEIRAAIAQQKSESGRRLIADARRKMRSAVPKPRRRESSKSSARLRRAQGRGAAAPAGGGSAAS
jgi:hypothetical protein